MADLNSQDFQINLNSDLFAGIVVIIIIIYVICNDLNLNYIPVWKPLDPLVPPILPAANSPKKP